MILNSIHNTATDRRWASNVTLRHTSCYKMGTTGDTVQQPSTTLKNSTPKLAGQNPESISQEAIYHRIITRTSSRNQVVEKLLWKPSEDAYQKSSWNQMSLSIRISMSSNSFRTVPYIVNGREWRCIVRDLESHSLTCIQFHSQKVTPLTKY